MTDDALIDELLEDATDRMKKSVESTRNEWVRLDDELHFIDLGDNPAAVAAALASKQVDGIYQGNIEQFDLYKAMPHVDIHEVVTAQTAVAREGAGAQLLVGFDQGVRAHACSSLLVSDQAATAIPLSRLNAVIISSHCGTRSCRPRQNAWERRRSKSASAMPCCSTQVK